MDSAEFLIQVEGREVDDNVGDKRWPGAEALAHGSEVGHSAEFKERLDRLGEFSLAGAFMGERQELDSGATGSFLTVASQ